MDKIKNAISGNSGSSQQSSNQQSSGQKQDYGDKGKRTGQSEKHLNLETSRS